MVDADVLSPSPIINTLADLYAMFEAEDFVDLNRRIYKNTDCGASISIEGTLPFAEASPQAQLDARAEELRDLLMPEYQRLLPQLEDAYKAASAEAQERIGAADADFHGLGDARVFQDDPARMVEAFVAWARTVIPDAFPVTDVVPDRAAVIYHNGRRDPIPASFLLTGFTIQTIVEGSDATVDSELFPLGTTQNDVDAWVKEMELLANDLWNEANEDEDEDEDASAM